MSNLQKRKSKDVSEERSNSKKPKIITEDEKEITTDEAKLYDRQIRLWGMDTQKRFRNAKILIIGLSGLSTEVIKNLVLSGVGSLTLADHRNVVEEDLGSQFFLPKSDIGKNKAQAAKERIQNLNPMVKIDILTTNILKDIEKKNDILDGFSVVCLNSIPHNITVIANEICRKKGIQFWCSQISGYYGFFFADMGVHNFVEETKVEQEKVIKKSCETYKSIEQSLKKNFKGLTKKKLKRSISPTFFALITPLLFQQKHNSLPTEKDNEELIKLKEEFLLERGLEKDFCTDEHLITVARNFNKELSPVCAILGGIFSQEILKGISLKDLPTKNYVVLNGYDLNAFVMDL
ncbi:SUMO-activating enzyme subunit 1 [Lobulomyces angularis]|nr:SUMO-activating enzyme subunit 1 [Lobulomyces angularis]